MALTIGTNNAAINSAASASSVNRDIEISMARLSSGKRINSASDDAAGVAISSRLSAEIRGTDQAIPNAQDGIALLQIAEGAANEISDVLQRMREIMIQFLNGTNNWSDRSNLATEFAALEIEIDRISYATDWAGQNIFDGNSSQEFIFQIGSQASLKDQLAVNIHGICLEALDLTVSDGDIGRAPISFWLREEHMVNLSAPEEYYWIYHGAVVTRIDNAVEKINTDRTALGAISNRLNHVVNNLTNISIQPVGC